MATAAQIALFRDLIREPDDTGGWTDAKIGAWLDARQWQGEPDMNLAAADAWTEKAADAVDLVDITENGSSRKMSTVLDNMQKMAAYYRGLSPSGLPAVTRPRTRAIVRP